MVNHYGKFIRCLADLSSPLNNLLKKDVQWNWSVECQETFLKIKETDINRNTCPFQPRCSTWSCLWCQWSGNRSCDLPQLRRWERQTHCICFQNPLRYREKLLPNRERSTQYYLRHQKISSVPVWKDILTLDWSQASYHHIQSWERNSNPGSQPTPTMGNYPISLLIQHWVQGHKRAWKCW